MFNKLASFDLKCNFCGNKENIVFNVQLKNNVPYILIMCHLCGNTEAIHSDMMLVEVFDRGAD